MSVETPEFAAMLERMIRAYARRVAEADEVDLARMVEVKRVMDEALADAVRGQRDKLGRSWAEIARGLGTTRQSAYERFARKVRSVTI